MRHNGFYAVFPGCFFVVVALIHVLNGSFQPSTDSIEREVKTRRKLPVNDIARCIGRSFQTNLMAGNI